MYNPVIFTNLSFDLVTHHTLMSCPSFSRLIVFVFFAIVVMCFDIGLAVPMVRTRLTVNDRNIISLRVPMDIRLVDYADATDSVSLYYGSTLSFPCLDGLATHGGVDRTTGSFLEFYILKDAIAVPNPPDSASAALLAKIEMLAAQFDNDDDTMNTTANELISTRTHFTIYTLYDGSNTLFRTMAIVDVVTEDISCTLRL